MKSKGFKGYFEWLVIVLVVLLILSLSTRITIGQNFEYRVFLNSSNASGYILNEPISVSNNTGANTYGIFIDNDTAYTLSNLTINATLTVNQTNSVFGNRTFGIYANGTFVDTAPNIGNLTITGNGAIKVLANGTYVFAGGIAVGSVTDNFTNQGTVTVTANGADDAGASGVRADSIGTFTNQGTITVTANGGRFADALGVGADSIGNFTNQGTITVTANGADGADASGVEADSIGTFTNQGIITVIANGTSFASAAGVEAIHNIGNFTNNGEIFVSAIASNGDAEAYGIKAKNMIGNFTFINHGTIKVSATGNNINATGIYVDTARTGSTILNNGIIEVYVSGNVDKVAGIYLTNSSVTLSNFGEIIVYGKVPSGAKLRTLYIDSGSNVTLKDKFAITFGAPGTGPGTAPIYVASGSTLNLNNATLVVRIWNNDASSIVLNTPYRIIEYNGTVNGNWGGLERGYTNPLIDVNWYNATTDKDAMVIFRYNPLRDLKQAMAPVSSITAAVTVNSFISGIVSALVPVSSPLVFVKEDQPVMLAASAVSDMPLEYGLGGATYRGSMWFMPVYTKVKATDLGFDADAYGFNLGFGGFLTRDLSLGLYATYARTEIDYRITGAKSGDVDLFAVGMTGRWTFMKNAYLRFNVNGFKTNNDYEGRTGMNYELKEKASYSVKGMEGEVMIGKVYRGKIALIPEIGLKYNYYNPDSFWTKAYNSTGRVPARDGYYSPSAQHVWKVVAGVNVVGDTKWGGNPVRLYLMGRVEQALGKNEVEVINYMRIDPTRTRRKLTKSISKTTFVGQVGVDVSLTKNFGVELSGRGDFNADYSAYTGRAVIWYKW